MIVLDTNVVSELMREEPNPTVARWLDQQEAREVWVSAIIAAELFYGIAKLPAGRKRDELAVALDRSMSEFEDRILVFDSPAAEHYGNILAGREQMGRPMSIPDAQIAATCRSRGATLATRNIRDFDRTGVDVINPWDQPHV